MSDIADRAQQENDLHLSLQLKHRKPTLQAKGRCHWCDSPVEANAHFCDAECRGDYEQHKVFKG